MKFLILAVMLFTILTTTTKSFTTQQSFHNSFEHLQLPRYEISKELIFQSQFQMQQDQQTSAKRHCTELDIFNRISYYTYPTVIRFTTSDES